MYLLYKIYEGLKGLQLDGQQNIPSPRHGMEISRKQQFNEEKRIRDPKINCTMSSKIK